MILLVATGCSSDKNNIESSKVLKSTMSDAKDKVPGGSIPADNGENSGTQNVTLQILHLIEF